MVTEVRSALRYQELLRNLIRKELKVKYKNSALGFVWSLLNPLLSLAIFSLVFRVLLRFGIPYYAFYLLSGLLAWNLFSTSLTTATQSIVGNASLVSKVRFPRATLPLASVGASAYHFGVQFAVLAGAMVIFGYLPFWDSGFALFPAALLILLVFVSALSFVLAALNVYFRDVGHLLELGLLAWFWMTPIVYASAWVQERLADTPGLWSLYLANPMTGIVLAFQRGLYAQVSATGDNGEQQAVLVQAPLSWYYQRLGYVAILSVVALAVCWMVFRRLEGRLAEEL
jgi:ABC-2 type transport system permease protein